MTKETQKNPLEPQLMDQEETLEVQPEEVNEVDENSATNASTTVDDRSLVEDNVEDDSFKLVEEEE